MIRRIVDRLYTSWPREILQTLRWRLSRRGPTPPTCGPPLQYVAAQDSANSSAAIATTADPTDTEAAAIAKTLSDKFATYQIRNLKGISAEEFRQSIVSRIGAIDPGTEGYASAEVERQRDMSVKFYWGHHHDFGDFCLIGRMKNRHIELLANFASLFPINLKDFDGKDVLDVGCWTGGTTLLLAALGSRVVAVEEVKKYAETAEFLARSFGIDNQVAVKSMSLYDCNSAAFHDRFDMVHFPGVIYHLSDPLIGLRILFNALKIGGIILVESAGINHDQPYCRFDGSLVFLAGTKEDLNRTGWNWFMPSPSALFRMMREAGFEQVKTLWHPGTERVFGCGRKMTQAGICRAGLSVSNIR